MSSVLTKRLKTENMKALIKNDLYDKILEDSVKLEPHLSTSMRAKGPRRPPRTSLRRS